MLKDTLLEVLNQIWPMLFIFTVVLVSVRLAYLIGNKQKIIIYKELLTLIFVIYVLILFYVVTFQDESYGTTNLIPFKEMLRYDVGSKLFFKNIIGNIVLFIPFGIFVSYFIHNRKFLPIFFLSLVSSLSIELTQSKIGRVFDIDDIMLNVMGGILGYFIYLLLDTFADHIPKIFRKTWFKNILVIILLILIILYLYKFDIAFLGFKI
ncbi:MAG: VanZ family protein [Bacilli bacterium]|nr:VanZ family protein [Bacilli bacterium]